MQTLPHIVIVGGGFAGLSAARALRKANARVTLIDRRVYNTFNPLLYQVASGGLNPGDVTYFLRGVRLTQRNLRVLHEHVVGVDTTGRSVALKGGGSVGFDYLILATGVTANFFGTPGAQEFAFPMYTRSQAIRIRDRVFNQLEHSSVSTDPSDGLRVVVVGGGPTGVEISGALAELFQVGLEPAYPEIDPRAFSVTLVEMSKHVLGAFDAKLRDYTERELRERGVTLRLGVGVQAVEDSGVVLADGTRLPSDLTIWSTGVTPHQEVADWGLPRGKGGRITVRDDYQVAGVPGVFAVGDISISPAGLPQLAQPAIQAGTLAARNVLALMAGRPTSPLHYHDKGTMAIIGRRAAIAQVAELPVVGRLPGVGLRLRGGIAWLAWLFVHIMGLIGPRNRFTTLAGIVTRYGFPFHRRPIPIVGDIAPTRDPKSPRP